MENQKLYHHVISNTFESLNNNDKMIKEKKRKKNNLECCECNLLCFGAVIHGRSSKMAPPAPIVLFLHFGH